MNEDRMPKLVQVSDKLEIGTNGHYIGSDKEGINIVDESGNPDKLTTGNLHVKGNLLIDTGHITEFDVGTAIFKDKVLELGASETISENMSDGTGIEAVENLINLDTASISGLDTDTLLIYITKQDLLQARVLTFGNANNYLTYDIASCSNMEDIKKILDKDPLFTNLFTASVDASGLTIISNDGEVFTFANVQQYDGPTILRKQNSQYKGWVFDKEVGINKEGVDNTLNGGGTDFKINTTAGNTVKVRDGYENDIVEDNTLINKKYADLNYLNASNITTGLHSKGIQFIRGSVDVDTSQNGNNGLPMDGAFSMIFPWITLEHTNTTDTYTLLEMYGTNYNLGFYIEGTDFIVREFNSNDITNELIFTTSIDSQVVRPVFAYDEDQDLLVFYLNDTFVDEKPFTFETNNFTSLKFGNGSEDPYVGDFSGEFILFNYDISEQIKLKASTDIWVPYSEQWGTFTPQTSGELKEGHIYDLNYVTGDFTSCGIPNESGEHLCLTTATPTWGTSNAQLQGSVMYLLFTRRYDLNIDILDLAHGRHGVLNDLVYFNDARPDQLNIGAYL